MKKCKWSAINLRNKMITLALILLGSLLFGATIGTSIVCCAKYPTRIHPRKVYFIDEYVSIAKQYFDNNNTGFVNGILDTIAKDIRS